MLPNILLPATTSLLGFAFAGIMLWRFIHRRRLYQLVWTLGLLWYALGDGAEALGAAAGWGPVLYRVWYITGAIGVAAYLGAGTLYLHRDSSFSSLAVVCLVGGSVPALATDHVTVGLLGLGSAILLTSVLSVAPARFADAALALLVVGSVVAAILIVRAPVDISLLPTSPDQIVSGQAFDAETRALSLPFNITGALVLVLGALISALHFWRAQGLPNRVASNVLIAVGAFIPGVASGLTRFGVTSVFFVGELVGLVFILAGFLLTAG